MPSIAECCVSWCYQKCERILGEIHKAWDKETQKLSLNMEIIKMVPRPGCSVLSIVNS